MEIPKTELEKIINAYGLDPVCGAREASYQAFASWIGRVPLAIIGEKGLDIQSLVDTFDADLREFAHLSNAKQNQKKGKNRNAIQDK